MKKNILTIICLLIFGVANASHIVGGEIFYNYLGNNNYQITLKLYRNCDPTCTQCAPYADPEYVTIFDGNGNVYYQLPMPEPDNGNPPRLPSTYSNPCIQIPPDICIQEADYTGSVTLPASTGGYTIVYQRCCRPNSLVNLEADQGATFTAEIPDSAAGNGNNSARFIDLPPQFVCLNAPISLSYAATDPDGDSLVYNLCDPYLGADANCVDPVPDNGQPGCPTAPNSPPYSSALYTPPYSNANFTNMPSTPGNFTINPQTGLLTGTPNTAGVFDITVCVSEYRNGHLLNTLRRDFQLIVTPCNAPSVSLPAQQSQCGSLTAHFTCSYYNPNPGIAVIFNWNFGVPGLSNDTSSLANPSYTYPDSGIYTVTLIGSIMVDTQLCIDTAISVVKIYPHVEFSDAFSISSSACIDSAIVFTSQTTSSEGIVDSVWWNFGDGDTSTQLNPTYTYTSPGNYYVSLYEQNTIGCNQSVTHAIAVSDCITGILNASGPTSNIHLYPNPANNSTILYYSPLPGQQVNLNIYNALGQLVKQQVLPASANSTEINTEMLQEGVYTYTVVLNEHAIKRDKFMVAR